LDKRLIVLASVLIGTFLFVVLLAFVGVENIAQPFKQFSLFYLGIFLLTTALLHIIATSRWATILKYQGFKVPFLLLLRYKLIGTAVSYITPASRIGGEPVRGYLFKNKLNIKGRQAFPSIFIETSLGMSIDVLFISGILITMLLFFTLPNQVAGIALAVSIFAILLIIAYYSTLINHLGPFSFMFKLFYALFRKPVLKKLTKKIVYIEENMIQFFRFKKRGVLEAILISSLSWPITFLQYKFALLSIGFNAPATIILLSIIAVSFAAIIPIPAAFGVQEAGQFSVFSIIAVGYIGIALSLIIRFKDLITTFIGLILLSHEGLSVLEVLKNKKN